MIKKEAIKYLQQLYPNGGHCWLDEQRIEAIGMAIQALQEEPVSIWHDGCEIPKSETNILMIRKEEKDSNYPPIAGCFHGLNSRIDGKNWGYYNGFCYNEIEAPYKWAYVDDFLALEEIPPKFPLISQKKCMYTKDHYTDEDRKVLCDGCKEKCEYSKKKEPVSEDLEEACEQLAENARKHKAETSSPFFSQTDYKQGVMDGAQWQKANLWKPADGDDLPIFDRDVIALLDNGKVVYAHRPPEYWDGKDIVTGKVTRNYPKTYDKGGWNIPNVKYWLDCQIPNMGED